jgi:hypothetical protein
MAVAAYADALDRMGLDIAEDVVDRARTEIVKVPSVAQLYEVARELRLEHAKAEQTPLYALPVGEVLAEWPAEVTEKVHSMIEGSKVDAEAEAKANDAEWERTKSKVHSRPRLAGVCTGAGQQVVEIDGKRVCPACGVEVPDIIVDRVPESRRESTFRKGRTR